MAMNFISVIYVIVLSLTKTPLKAIALKIMIPFIRPSISPLLLLIRDAIYPPKNTEMHKIRIIIYARYSYGNSDEKVSIAAILHIIMQAMHTDETTPTIIALI